MSTMYEIKDRKQKECVNEWYKNKCKGTLQLATGVGKSRIGVLTSQWLVGLNPEASILIITPTQTIRDSAWKDEFKKWKALRIFEYNVECVCIQTAYKYVGKHWDLIIADEIHNYLSDQYFKVFTHNKYDRLLGLSASIDIELLPKLNLIAPVCVTIDTNLAVELGLISPFIIYNLYLEMSEKDKKEYSKWDGEFFETFSIFDKDLNKMFACLNKQAFINHLINRFGLAGASKSEIDAIYEKYKTYPFRCQTAMAKRKELLYENEAKFNVIKEISDMFGNRKGVIFNQTSSFADKIGEEIGETCVVEHSNIKPKKQRIENLKKFQDNRTKVRRISAVRSLNEGANLKGVDFIIIASGTSKIKEFVQRTGRSVRWEDGKTAIIVKLVMKNTQEEKWTDSSQEGYAVIRIDTCEELRRRLMPVSEIFETVE